MGFEVVFKGWIGKVNALKSAVLAICNPYAFYMYSICMIPCRGEVNAARALFWGKFAVFDRDQRSASRFG